MHGGIVMDSALSDLRDLLLRLTKLRGEVLEESRALLESWGAQAAGPSLAVDMGNLADYLALRRHDLSEMQGRLAAYGLSSLGRSEAKTIAALDALIATLKRLCGETDAPYPDTQAMRAGGAALQTACDAIFGVRRPGAPHARIMATLPSEAANDAGLVERLIAAGMDCARINCAHDDAGVWAQMIAHIRTAEQELGKPCRILMDIAGPKCRIASLRAPEKFRAHRGDHIFLAAKVDPAAHGPITIAPSFPQILDQLEVGAEVWINDGKIGANVVSKSKGHAELEVFSARAKGERLKLEKGLNFPTTALDLSPLTEKDFVDLDFVAQHADLIGFSFVQKPSDVELLQDHLAARRGGRPLQPIILKIETPLAVRNLPQLILQSATHNPTAVMIARGDLAVELGFARLSEIQEEILWLCEAAHVPAIWAMQVLDNLVREGVASRAETTDAATAQGADCVMLNKGTYLAEGVAFLRDVLTRMDRHHAKKFARYTPLQAWGSSPGAPGACE